MNDTEELRIIDIMSKLKEVVGADFKCPYHEKLYRSGLMKHGIIDLRRCYYCNASITTLEYKKGVQTPESSFCIPGFISKSKVHDREKSEVLYPVN